MNLVIDLFLTDQEEIQQIANHLDTLANIIVRFGKKKK